MMKKRIRLETFDYLGPYRYFVTICTDKKIEVFTSSVRVRVVSETLIETARQEEFKIWTWCFMPNHLHILVEGTSEVSDFRKFMRVFKQKSSYRWKQIEGRRLWQEDYYERILRREETTLKVMEYILNNPVRRGLVSSPEEYLFSFSLLDNDM